MTEKDTLFEELPLSFEEWIASKDHIYFPTLSERQKAVTNFMFYQDSTMKTFFENKNTTSVLVYGKGSGKDTIACLVTLYIVYYLLCMKNPQQFFGLPDSEPIDLVNVAQSAEQASNVYFTKFKNFIKRWMWLKRKYKLKLSGVSTSRIRSQEYLEGNFVEVTRNAVIFPKGIRAISGHSKGESLEGLNVLCFVLDEASGFVGNDAEELYNILRSSAVSRFGTRYKCFILSYPRSPGPEDFTLSMYYQGQRQLHWFTDLAATWEVKPRELFQPETFIFNGRVIPRDFEQDYLTNPYDAMMKYECIGVAGQNRFFEFPGKVDECVDWQLTQILEVIPVEEPTKVKRVPSGKFSSCKYSHVIGVDLGLKNDTASLSMVHKTEEGLFILDLLSTWVPDVTKGRVVDFDNVKDFIVFLAQHYQVVCVVFDQWNSAHIMQQLNKHAIPTDLYSLKVSDYNRLKELVYTGKLKLYPDAGLASELKSLVYVKGKVDHPNSGSKDRVDSLVAAIKYLSEYPFVSSETGSFLTNNLEQFGGTFLKIK